MTIRSTLTTLGLCACAGKKVHDTPTPDVLLPDVSAATFTTGIDNPYLPFPPGATWIYDNSSGEHIEVTVTSETREIQGVTATVVVDVASEGGVTTEDTRDWYAQDTDGNVWYLGEDSCAYEGGVCVDTEGSWEWGVGGALPGLVMPATPTVDGQPYYQEYSVGHAEDTGEVLALGLSKTVAAGSFEDCIETRDSSTLETDMNEHKFYCRGVGLVLTEEDDDTEALTSYSGL